MRAFHVEIRPDTGPAAYFCRFSGQCDFLAGNPYGARYGLVAIWLHFRITTEADGAVRHHAQEDANERTISVGA
jgi:hypothetical protein